ncbi:MAG: hypothetical protein LIO69_03920, partial [Oscillospiraceae bacterium]|nr:hypothetical protein [Oscillospiraceae bacterium]
MIYNVYPFSGGTISQSALAAALQSIGDGKIVGASSGYTATTPPDGYDYGCAAAAGSSYYVGLQCVNRTDEYVRLYANTSSIYCYAPSVSDYKITPTADTLMTVTHDENGLAIIFDGMPFLAFARGISITDGTTEQWQIVHMMYDDDETAEKGIDFYISQSSISHSLLKENIAAFTASNEGVEGHVYKPLIYKGYKYPIAIIKNAVSSLTHGTIP